MRHRLLALWIAGVVAAAGCSAVSPGRGLVRAPEAATGALWQWETTVTPVERIGAAAPERYTLELQAGGVALVRADCNRGRASYEIGEGRIKLGPIATTRMACAPGSLDTRFLQDLERATTFFVQDGRLYLELPMDSGTMRFARGK